MKRPTLLLLLAIPFTWLMACSAQPLVGGQGGALPQYYLEDSGATGTAAVRDIALTSAASNMRTAQWVDTQSALSVAQTSQALSLTAGAATSTQAIAETRHAATETEAPRQTETAVAGGTPTAAAQQTAISGTATAQAPYDQQHLYFTGGLLLVCLGSLAFAAIMFGLGLRWVMGAVSDRINQTAVATADAIRTEASARAEKDKAEAAKTNLQSMRQNMVRVGPYLIHFTADGPVVFKTIEELQPARPSDDVDDVDPVDGMDAIRRPNDDPLERLSSGQAAMARFLQVCLGINGAGSNVIPTADKLEAKGVSRDERQLMIDILKGLRLVRAKTGQGTWLVGEYPDLKGLLQACLSGSLPVPDVEIA